MEAISKYITYHEATHSNHADAQHLANTPDTDTLCRMKAVAAAVFDPLREHFGKPIGISSFYRSSLLNYILKGAPTSQHVKGEAIDIDGDIYGGITNKEIFDFIRHNLVFDQLISEFGTEDNPDWVHVSYSLKKNRNQVLRSITKKGRTVYKSYV
jgi:hypothetical protein